MTGAIRPVLHLSTCPQAVSLYGDCTCGASSPRSEPEVREKIRLARLKADLRAEGANEAMVARLATPDHAKRMLEYEDAVVGFINEMFAR